MRSLIAIRWTIAVILILAASTTQCRAWGSEGHRIVAEIAERFLEPETSRRLHELLALENQTTLASVSNWADQIRGQRPNTASWHFVDIPISRSSYEVRRDCPRGNCVVAKIDDFAAKLADKNAPPVQRLEALKFLVHFIGDVHQPLHASNNRDHGGNDIHVEFKEHKTNLHALWDSRLLTSVVHGDERAYALNLAHSISAADYKTWKTGSAADWANESHTIAVQVLYGELPHGPGAVPSFYEAKALPIIDQQMKKAGVRLAVLLNSIPK